MSSPQEPEVYDWTAYKDGKPCSTGRADAATAVKRVHEAFTGLPEGVAGRATIYRVKDTWDGREYLSTVAVAVRTREGEFRWLGDSDRWAELVGVELLT